MLEFQAVLSPDAIIRLKHPRNYQNAASLTENKTTHTFAMTTRSVRRDGAGHHTDLDVIIRLMTFHEIENDVTELRLLRFTYV